MIYKPIWIFFLDNFIYSKMSGRNVIQLEFKDVKPIIATQDANF